MRRHGPVRFFLSLLLAAWLPWCLCDRLESGCCEQAEAAVAGSAVPVAATAEESCGGSCCSSHETPLEERPASDDPCRPFGQCEAGCCVTKGLVSASLPEIPVDSIGVPLPATVVPVLPETGPDRTEPALHGNVRAAGPRAGPGRADSARRLLVAICIQTT